jgi:hypothetical protein
MGAFGKTTMLTLYGHNILNSNIENNINRPFDQSICELDLFKQRSIGTSERNTFTQYQSYHHMFKEKMVLKVQGQVL